MADHVYNTEYAMAEFTRSGEVQLMDKLSEFSLEYIFDVGANIGEWAKMVATRQIDPSIHCFEPVPEVFLRLIENTRDLGVMVMPNPFGLSSTCELRDMLFDADNDRLTTPCLEIFRNEPSIRNLIFINGADYCTSRQIDRVDFLKIDTEGHEYKVLLGFERMLKEKKVTIIQFEYGYANVLTKDLLIDHYKYLEPMGYSIGLLTPEGVDFKTYGLLDENFQGPNYVAVLKEREDIIAKIQMS
jgi:FkbM family methyltransferase